MRKRAKNCVVAFPIAILSNLTGGLLSFPYFPWDTSPIKVSRQTERLLLLIVFTENFFVFVQVYAQATHHADENKTPPGGDSHVKRAWMLVVSLSGVNFRFWSQLGCSGQTAPLYLAIEITFRVALEEIYIFNSFYLLDSCTQSLK